MSVFEEATNLHEMQILFVIHAPRDPHTAVYSNYSQRARFLDRHGHQTKILVPADLLPDGYCVGV